MGTYLLSNFLLLNLMSFHSVDPPKVSRDPENQSVATGADTMFRVEATGDELQFQWQKDGIDIDSSEPRLHHNSVRNASTLHIKDTKKSDTGHYKCLLKNLVEKRGKVSHEAKLTVCKLSTWSGLQFNATTLMHWQLLPKLQGVTTSKS